jgi:Flp pilus assembly pilin Flp
MSNVDERIKRHLEPFIEDYRRLLVSERSAGATDAELARITAAACARMAATFTDNPEILAWLTAQFHETTKAVVDRPPLH